LKSLRYKYKLMADMLFIGDIVQVTDLPGLLNREAAFMQYLGMVGVIVEKGINTDCWIVQFDDDNEVEIPAVFLYKE
jgi:hypothetical protein